MKNKYRIIRKYHTDGSIYYQLQERCLWFFWFELVNTSCEFYDYPATFPSQEKAVDAIENLHKSKLEIVLP